MGRYAPYRASSRSSTTLPTVTSSTGNKTWRDTFLDILHEQLPGFEPRNDFDIFTLGTTEYQGIRAELNTWLDRKLAVCVRNRGSYEAVMEQTRAALALPSSTITGVCPAAAAYVYATDRHYNS